jgi:hypothetical protein
MFDCFCLPVVVTRSRLFMNNFKECAFEKLLKGEVSKPLSCHDFIGYLRLTENFQFLLAAALQTYQWPSFIGGISMIHRQSLHRFELASRIPRWSDQQLCDPANLTVLRSALTQSLSSRNKQRLSDDEVEQLYSIEPAHAASIIIPTNMNAIPTTLISMIFSFLEPCHQLLGSCILVSRQWCHIVTLSSSCTHWTEYQINRWNSICRVVPNWLSHVQHLTLLQPSQFPQSIDMFDPKRLTSLTIDRLNDGRLGSFLTTFTSVSRLYIRHANKIDLSTFFQDHPSLTDCSIMNIEGLSSLGVIIPSQMRHLTLLALPNAKPIIDAGNARSLQSLSLNGSWSIINAYGAAASLLHLEIIQHQPQSVATTTGLARALSTWKHLERIKLAHATLDNISSDAIQQWKHIRFIKTKVSHRLY